MATQPRFFLARPSVTRQGPSGIIHDEPGPIVPLVPLDELPHWIEIVGVPRELTVEDTAGMLNLGTVAKSEAAYAVRIMFQPSSPAPSDWADDGTVDDYVETSMAVARRGAVDGGRPEETPVAVAGPSQPPAQIVEAAAAPAPAPEVHPADRMKAHWNEAHACTVGQQSGPISKSTAQQQQQQHRPPPQPAPNTASDKQLVTTRADHTPPTPSPVSQQEYCRHWCHYGTCKWGQQCRYLHAMPNTPSGMLEVGLSTPPVWWLTEEMLRGSSGAGRLHDIGGPAAVATRLRLGVGDLGPGRGLDDFQQQRRYLAILLQQQQQLEMLGGGGGGRNKKNKAQLKKMASELGLLTKEVFRRAPPRRGREMTPLDKGRKKAVASEAATAAVAQGKPVPVGEGLVAAPARVQGVQQGNQDQAQVRTQEAREGMPVSENGQQSRQQQGQAAATKAKAKKQSAEAKAPAMQPAVGKLVEV
ncbi:hypothetical protein B0H67DRAFT_639697 [Lasiosphaeris hirsuta]|uniref:C3H1-type domain-containing protein n=1 Tax=Lasiosphaeris hirsuta TaxID=260670 RepID=A0AA40EAN8_9PEZI|nr:hypothetical protein B0H67DRAFT_639697 [Lasiosphaeris hirsuta]